jgi:putative membrane protein
MKRKTPLLEIILFFLRGIFMGMADVVPGVSGGTIAFITGIYQRLINSISKFDLSFILLFIQGKWKKSWKLFKSNDWVLFIPLGLGISIAIFFLSKLIQLLLEHRSGLTFAFFFGLILASAFVLLKNVGKLKFEKIILLVLGFVFAYALAGASSFNVNHSLFMIFFSGALAICAMILPGISGAFILLLLNQYEYLISALHTYQLVVVFVFLLGALFGLFSFAKGINFLLKKFRFLTISFLIGLMLGSLRVPVNEINLAGGVSLFIVISGVVGFLIVFGLEWLFKK